MLFNMARKLRVPAVLVIPLLLFGCGYHIAGRSGRMPGEVSSIAIPVFINESRKPNMEGVLTDAFTKEFSSTIAVTESGEAILRGTIKSYELRPVSYTKFDVNQAYRLTVVISIMVSRQGKDGAILYSGADITDYEDFTVVLTDPIATEEAEMRAFRKIAGDTARNVKDNMVIGF